jgi:hypothetical protein
MSHDLVVPVPNTMRYLQELQASAPSDVVLMQTGLQIGEEVKRVSVKLDPGDYPTVECIMLTDLQYGHIMCKQERIIEFRDWILEKPNRFCFFGGDMVDAATQLSVGSPYDNRFEPSQQLLRFCEIMMPLRHRVLGYVGGNHERRACKCFGSIGKMIATFLQIPYSEGRQLIDIHFGDHRPFTVTLWHGGGAARTKGAKAQMIDRFMKEGDSQLYLCGHLHSAIVLYDWRQKRDGMKVELQKVCGAMSSSFLEYWGTYGEIAGLPAFDTLMARVILEPDGGWEVTLR